MPKTHIFIFILGVVILAISIFRLTRKRLEESEPYDQYIKRKKLKELKKEDEFGRNVKWVVDERKDNE